MDTIEAKDTSELFPLLESVLGAVVADTRALGMNKVDVAQADSDGGAGLSVESSAEADRHQSALEAVPAIRATIGLAVLDAASLTVVNANGPFAGIVGRSDDGQALHGLALSDLMAEMGAAEVAGAVRHAADTGEAFACVIGDEQSSRKRYLKCGLVPLRRDDGAFATLLLTVVDVTEEMSETSALAPAATETPVGRAAVETGDVMAQSAMRAEVGNLLARVNTLSDALPPVAKAIAGPFGDCCAIFQVNDDHLQLAALHHRDASEETRLRAAFTQEPPPRDGELIGQVVASGNSMLASHWGPQYAEVALGLHASVEAARIESLACVPLRADGFTHGALLLFSTQAAAGGSGRTLGGGDLAVLQEMGDLLAHAMSSAQARAELASAHAERNVILDISAEGIAVYDALGRLRLLNRVGRTLLSRPADAVPEAGQVGGTVTLRRTFLTPEGLPLTTDELPWSRAVRGERVGADVPMRIVLEWAGGVRRTLLMRAWPVVNGSETPTGAVVAIRDADQGERPADTAQDVLLAGDGEWARWRETMELLDEAVVLCATDGAAVFINSSARELLGLPMDDINGGQNQALWEYVRQLDGAALPKNQTPVANALTDNLVRAQPTAVPLADGTMRPIYWDARRIDGTNGGAIGVALVAWPAMDDEEFLDPQDTQPVEPAELTQPSEQIEQAIMAPTAGMPETPVAVAQPAPTPVPAPTLVPAADKQLVKTTLLPGRRTARWEAISRTTGEGPWSDLTEVCARAARAHRGTIQRRLEIRLPRRSVLVPVEESQLERAVGALISTAAQHLPPNIPLHVAVWVERAASDDASALAALIPPGMDVSEVTTVRFQNGQLPAMLPPMQAISAEATTAQRPSAAVAVVRVCSPNVRDETIDVESFAICKAMVEAMGGSAWARVDPVLGPTYSFNLPAGEAGEP